MDEIAFARDAESIQVAVELADFLLEEDAVISAQHAREPDRRTGNREIDPVVDGIRVLAQGCEDVLAHAEPIELGVQILVNFGPQEIVADVKDTELAHPG